METSMLMLKPHSVRERLFPIILSYFTGHPELSITGIKMVRLTTEQAMDLYEEHKGRDYFDWLVRQITAGPVIAIAVSGEHVVETLKAIVGDTDPPYAALGTIRNALSRDTKQESRDKERGLNNCTHTPDPERAEIELGIIFGPDDLFNI